MSAPAGPLAGIVVLDLGQIYQGPYAGQLLAQAGATVVKVEPPGGEPVRIREALGKRTLPAMATLNQHKRAITLNLKHARGRELLIRLAEREALVAFLESLTDEAFVRDPRFAEPSP